MKKSTQRTVGEFLSMDTTLRDKLFSTSYNETPSMEARAKLFVNLPVDEAVRILSEVKSCIEIDHFLFDRVFELPNTKTFVFNEIIPKLSATRSVLLMFQTAGPFQDIKEMFNLLPIETGISIIDEGCRKTPEHEEATFEIFYERIEATKKERLDLIIRGIKPESLKAVIEYRRGLLDREKQVLIERIPLIEDEKKIAAICSAVSIKKALLILTRIEDEQKQKNVLELLSQSHKNAFFSKIADGKRSVLKSSEIDVGKLSLEAKKLFFRKFPNSKQISKLSIPEKIEIFL